MVEIPWYKKCIGYLYPIVIARDQNDKHPNLKIKYFQGQIQLESNNALYSDGHRYSPFRLCFSFLKKKNELHCENFLLLGAGLGSALHCLQKTHDLFPNSTLVEYDKDILALSKQYLLKDQKENIELILSDALDYVQGCKQTFDLIGIDLFENLENSSLISNDLFWQEVKKISHSKSNIIVNTIFIEKKVKKKFEALLSNKFTFDRIERRPNYFYILKHN